MARNCCRFSSALSLNRLPLTVAVVVVVVVALVVAVEEVVLVAFVVPVESISYKINRKKVK